MKRINILATLALMSAFLLASCGDTEPVDPAVVTGNTNDEIIGRYRLTAFNTDVQTDLNNDGNKSTNQMSETACYNNMFLTLNEDNTFTADSKGVGISATDALQCSTAPIKSGTWVYTGGQLLLTYAEGAGSITDSYTVSGDQISLRDDQAIIVGVPIDTPEFLSSGITKIYTKQ
ncbi:hypothetical protein FLJC2902T_31460 [Flavobacterium limnosediminis JC2902]|uniref:Lipocalin-like domain-containing protein n=1 Tax=Flavobacterium limnosediminis JC2902 TaxID=1341181 RepID=V6SF68_9FLAO|nr:lipocalin family protein [Flavobacterium limnosediminis]ESU25338.1 hypothetical protein FLJC2902T_31460 [Flavobacterium limnosediminis JC2902]